MPSIKIADKNCLNVQFSPFFPKYIACVTSQHFGLEDPTKWDLGIGSLAILENDGSEHLKLLRDSVWPHVLLDVSWLRAHENLLATSSCDGSLQLWKLFGSNASSPIMVFKEHGLDVTSLDTNEHFIASGSWDSTLKVWDITKSSSLVTLEVAQGVIRSVKWSRSFPNLLLSVSKKHQLILWDKNCPLSSVHKLETSNNTALDCDWSYFDPYLVATCGGDGVIRCWDIRSLNAPRNALIDKGEAHTRIKFSPHYPNVIATTSYNLSTGIWDVDCRGLVETVRHHSAIILGLDFNYNVPGEMTDCGFDSLLHVFSPWSLLEFHLNFNMKNKL